MSPYFAVVSGCTALLSLVVLLVKGFSSVDDSSVELGIVERIIERFKFSVKSREATLDEGYSCPIYARVRGNFSHLLFRLKTALMY